MRGDTVSGLTVEEWEAYWQHKHADRVMRARRHRARRRYIGGSIVLGLVALGAAYLVVHLVVALATGAL